MSYKKPFEKKDLSFTEITIPDKKFVYEDLNTAIMYRGMSKKDMAAWMETSEQHLSMWLNGAKGISEGNLFKLAELLEMDPYDLSRILKARRDARKTIDKIRQKNKEINNELEDLQKEKIRSRVGFFNK